MTIEELIKPKAKKKPVKKSNSDLSNLDYLKILWFLLVLAGVCKGINFLWLT